MLRSLAGGALFGELWGTSPPQVVALHGWRRTHSDFAGAFGPSSAGGPLPTVAPDLPGFGATPPPSSAWGSDDYAAVVADLITGPDGVQSPVVVVGHSLGGRVAATLAARRPELVRGLVLTGALLATRGGPHAKPPLRFRTLRSLHRLGLVADDRVERARQRYGSEDYRSAHGVMRDVLVRLVNEDYDDVLARIQCPVELVWGTEDREVPASVGTAVGERLARANLTLCDSGHLLPLECPAELRRAVERAFAAGEDLEMGDQKREGPAAGVTG